MKVFVWIQAIIYTMIGQVSFAQNFEEDMERIFSAVDSSSSASLEVEVELYSSKNGNLVYSAQSSYNYNEEAMISVLGDIETYRSATHEIVVDNEEKRILIHKKVKQDLKISKGDLKEIKKLLEAESNDSQNEKPLFKLQSDLSDIRVYTCSNLAGMKEVTFTLNVAQNKIVSIIYEFSSAEGYQGQYCVLTYTEFNLSPGFSSSFFARSNYYSYSDGEYKLSQKYSGYKLFTE